MIDDIYPNRVLFNELMFENANNIKMAQRIVKLTAPFFERASSGVYRLKKAKQLNRYRIINTVNHSLCPQPIITKIEFLSVGNPFSRPKWMTVHSYRQYLNGPDFNRCIHDSVNPVIPALLRRKYYLTGLAEMVDIEAQAKMIFAQCFGVVLNDLAKKEFPVGIDAVLKQSLQYLIGVGLMPNDSLLDYLAPYIRLLPRAIPYGVRRDRDDTLIVLVS